MSRRYWNSGAVGNDIARHGGFTYIGLLIFIALIGIGLASTGQVWHSVAQREKEFELLFAGNEFRRAIASYHAQSPDGSARYPRSFEDLLEDRRGLAIKRHLRRIYRDPMTNSTEWGLVSTPQGLITGVYSLADEQPRKLDGFRVQDEMFAGASHYSDWKFFHTAPEAAIVAGTAPPPPGQPSTVPLPPNPVTEPIPVTPPPKPLSKCERLNAMDQIACRRVEARWSAADGESCRASAAQRQGACAASLPLPGLYIRYR